MGALDSTKLNIFQTLDFHRELNRQQVMANSERERAEIIKKRKQWLRENKKFLLKKPPVRQK